MRASRVLLVPASFFGVVLGLAGLGNTWRAAHAVWGLSAVPGETLMLAATIVWFPLIGLYLAKWIASRDQAIGELYHPVQCCFVGLIGVATMLIAGGVLPYARHAAQVLFSAGALFTLLFALWKTGLLWRGERDPGATTPILYLPTVAGAFVTAAGLAAFGYRDWGQLAFGAGFFSWLAIESVLLQRLYTGTVLPPALRPTLGIQLAPPAVGAVAYLGVTDAAPDLLANALLGYGLLQALLLLRQLPWIVEQPFAPSYWAFTFGATALATVPLRMLGHGAAGAVARLAPLLFACANVLLLGIVAATLWLLVRQLASARSVTPSSG